LQELMAGFIVGLLVTGSFAIGVICAIKLLRQR